MKMIRCDAPQPDTANSSNARPRAAIGEGYRWNLQHIFDSWEGWEGACTELGRLIDAYAKCKGTLAGGAAPLLAALRRADELGQLSYRVWYYPALAYDEDQRDNAINERRQRAQMLLARAAEAGAWFSPELLAIPLETIRQWLDQDSELTVYRFALEEVYRQQEHVLDDAGEQLLALASRFEQAPGEAYASLTTADMKWPTIRLSSGEEAVLSYGRYRAILARERSQADRAASFRLFHGLFDATPNTYASLYSSVVERDWFVARARRYESTLAAALHGDNIPQAVVENLIATTSAGTEPLRRYHRLRRQWLGLEHYYPYDGAIPVVEHAGTYPYDQAVGAVVASVAPLGETYQQQLREAFEQRWIDVYENDGKRSGAYAASVYGVHPYVLLNYNDTLDDLFTLAHEMGHAMHTVLSHQHQPFVYASYTIFVAEVASTLNEALLLEHLLAQSTDPVQQVVLLQHAIDAICGTFYTQVLFADWELRAHRLLEQGQPLTGETLSGLYRERLERYYGDAVELEPLHAITWARIPHFFRSPYYVYQYATCFASSAKLLDGILRGSEAERAAAVKRYLGMLSGGSSDHPMDLLRGAGVDLADPTTVQAVVTQLDRLLDRLEQAMAQLPSGKAR